MTRLRNTILSYSLLLFFNILLSTSLFAQDAALTVEWDANKEPDLSGYKIYWGTLSRRYTSSKWVGKETNCLITGLQDGVRYYFAITASDVWGNESAHSQEVSAYAGEIQAVPQISLQNNYPNPFNPGTTITFELPESENVEMVIFNSLGQNIKVLVSGTLDPGLHTVYWDGMDEAGLQAASGMYYYQLKAQSLVLRKKMLLVH